MHERGEDGRRADVAFGSASLLEDRTDLAAARSVLEAALDAGAARLDVAPMYGHGLTEPLVLEIGRERGVPVTTKVGIEPRPRPSRGRRSLIATVDRLPLRARAAVRRAAGAGPADPFAPSGRFGLDAVRASVERSLQRGGRLDRLLLHEVQPPDVTDELLALLNGYRARGDVRELGCATRNAVTVPVLERGAGVLTVAHVSAAPLGDPVPSVPAGVRLVGHGALGPGGGDLRRLRALLQRGGPADAWAAATAGTRFATDGGLVPALLARARGLGIAELLVATTRRDRAGALVDAAAAPGPLGADAADVLERAVRRCRTNERGGS